LGKGNGVPNNFSNEHGGKIVSVRVSRSLGSGKSNVEMSIHFISGKPGGGKTLYSVKLIVEELVHGTRMIVTNVPLRLGVLNEYLQREYPNHQCNLVERVFKMTDEETAVFWTVRPYCAEPIRVLNKGEWMKGEKPSYAGVRDKGIFYAIDEVHNFFNSRAWMETGRDVLYYLSQHRKLGDTVICITQAVENVDKQFRSVTQDFTYLRNLSKETFGKFKMPSIFVRKTFGSPPTEHSQPMETGTFRLDVTGLASCYDTAQGVGIHGRNADIGAKKKGIPIWVLLCGIPAIVIAIYVSVPKLGAMFFAPNKAALQVSAPSINPVTIVSATRSNVQQQLNPQTNYVNTVQSPMSSVPSNSVPTPPEVLCVGIERLTGPWRAFLSDGTSYRAGEGLEEIRPNGIIVMGKWIRFAKPVAGPPLPPPVPPVSQPIQQPAIVEKPAIQVTYFGKRIEREAELPRWPQVEQTQQINQQNQYAR